MLPTPLPSEADLRRSVVMKAKDNALRIVRFDSHEQVMGDFPTHGVGYRGCNHEGFDGGGHHLPVGSVWQDIWGTEWHREHEGVIGFPRGTRLADLPATFAAYSWPDHNDDRIVRQIYEKADGWRPEETFLMPEYKRLFAIYKSKGVLVNFHSCGHIEPALDLFMNLGVDILNPVQATANDLDMARGRTEGRMALQGGISSELVASGPISAIRSEVHRRIWQLGRRGGYFCSPDQGMPWPEANIQALWDAVAEFGQYPLQEPQQEKIETEPEGPGYGSQARRT